MLLHRMTLSIVLLIFFFISQTPAYQDDTHRDDTHQDCIFPKPIEPVLLNRRLTEERITGLDAFWAQEYVGADLLRKKLEETDGIKKVTTDLVQIWDTKKNRHEEYVSHIIAGPFPSAVIPQPHPIDITTIPTGHYEYLYEQCQRENNCPAYINNSMSWIDPITKQINPMIKDVFYAMNKGEGTVITTSAGNDSRYVSKAKEDLAKSNNLIVVASLDPFGNPSHFSNYSINTTISAPSDDMIRSYDFEGNPHSFGGTSGATPLTKGALTSFTVITDYILNTRETKHLLKKTAIHFPNLPSSNSMGYGILNAYKIGEVGFKLNEICQNDRNEDQCIASYLNIDSTYEFDLEEEKEKILRQAQVAFPICFSETNTLLDSTTCEDKHNVLERLRQIAFLDSSDQRFWQTISCIKRQSGLTKHAEFYAKLAERLDMSDEEIIHRMIENQNYEQLLRYAISIESLNQVIIPILNDRNTQSRFLIMALRSIEFILPYYEDIPNFEGILTKVIRHDNADVRVFSDVNQIIKDHFSKIPNAENILRYNVNHQNSPPPISAVLNNLNKLSAPEFFLRTIPDAERSNGAIVQYIFRHIIDNYNNTPDAKEISTSLINNDKLKDGDLAAMARQLIKNYDQNSDFKEMLQAIIDSPQADLLTINYIIDNLIQSSENFEDFDHFFSAAIHHEKANELTIARAVRGFIRYYNNPFNRNSVFQSIINNQYVSFACGTAIYTMANNSSPNNPRRYIPTITRIPENLELIYLHCNNKIDIGHLSDITDNIIQNTTSLGNIPNAIELDMLRFVLRQDVIDQALLNSIRTFIQSVQVTDEVRIEINQLIQEAKSKNSRQASLNLIQP